VVSVGLVPVWQAEVPDAGTEGSSLVARWAPESGLVGAVPSRFRVSQGDGGAVEVLQASVQIAVRSGGAVGMLRGGDVLNAVGERVFTLRAREADGARRYLMPVTPGPVEQGPAFVVITDERFIVINAANGDIFAEFDARSAGWPLISSWSNTTGPVLFYTDHSANTVDARNMTGARPDGFPITAPNGFQFTGTPLVIHSGDSEASLLLAMATDGYSVNILVYNASNLRYPSETLLVGSDRPDLNPIQPAIFDGTLFAASPSGDLRAWRLKNQSNAPSSYIYGSPDTNTPGIELQPTGPVFTTELLVGTETYNWPNPAADHTHIRFMTREPSDITITIIDYSGRQVHESQSSTPGGLPQEFRLNTSTWGNGVYFTRITARSGSATEHKVFTMVIIR
jgi:hypothetical protein